MLGGLIRFSIRRAPLVVALGLILLAFTATRLPKVQVDVFPELNAPTVVVLIEAPGLAATEVEQDIALPVEAALGGVVGLHKLRTSSLLGFCLVTAQFGFGDDVLRARQLVTERLDLAGEVLPANVHVELAPITSVTGEILLLALSSPDGTRSPYDLRSYAEFDLARRLRAVRGVAQVSVLGGELPELQVRASQPELQARGMDYGDVVQAARDAHSRASAGYLADVGGEEWPIVQRARATTVREVASSAVWSGARAGSPLRLGDVAEVAIGPVPRRGAGSDNGIEAVILAVQKAPDTNTLEITARVDGLLDQIDGVLPEGMALNRETFRQAEFIERAIGGVSGALRDAAIVVALVLLAFLANLRTTGVTLVALPLSLACGWLALEALGETINVMTLGGLAIAVGSLVDDAIIDVENVWRRMRENAALPKDRQRKRVEVIAAASNEIRPAMVLATVIIALVFAPLFFLGGLEGRFFRPLGIAFVVSLVASLFVALTVTPALCRLLLRVRETEGGAERDGWLTRLLKRLYRPVLEAALRLRLWVVGGAALASGLALALVSTFGTSFLPGFSEGTFLVQLFAQPGTSLVASDRMAGAVERRLMQIDGVASVSRRTGRAEGNEHVEPVGNSELDVVLAAGAKREAVAEQIEAVLDGLPGVATNLGQPIEHRLSHVLSGTPAAIAISIFGEDLIGLREVAREVEAALADVPGTRDVVAQREARVKALSIRYVRERLAAYGLTPGEAARQVRAKLVGEQVATLNDGPRRMGLTVRLTESERDDPEDVARLILVGSSGQQARLSEVADLGPEPAPVQISREDGRRRALISLGVGDGTNLGHLVERVAAAVDPIVRERGFTVAYGGQFEAQRTAGRTLAFACLVVLAGVLLLLELAIGSVRVSLLVLANLPLALIGGVVAVFWVGSPDPWNNLVALLRGGDYLAPVLSIASLVGFVTLFGIAVRGGLLLVGHYAHLTGDGVPLREAVVRGSSERLVPVLMTASTAALALMPIVLAGSEPGSELLAPLSVVIVGGLVSSTLLNLLVIPAGYLWIGGVRGQETGESEDLR